MKKSIVIGAGIAGIATSIRLAKKGYTVEVYESNAYPGVKLSAFSSEGFRFDAGPSLFTMPQYVDALFELCDEDIEEVKQNTEEMNMSYSIKYITDICKFCQLSNTITLKFSDEIPLLLRYNIDENIKADFHLAPYMDEDEENE